MMEGLLWGLFGLVAGLCGLVLPWLFSLGRGNRDKIERAQSAIDVSASAFRELRARLEQVSEEHTEERKRTRQRLENLEAIVTSRSWDALQSGVEAREQGLLLEGRAEPALRDEEKVKRIARRVD